MAALQDAEARKRLGFYPLDPQLSAKPLDAQLAYWKERQRHLLWAVTKLEQKLGLWEKKGFTDEEQFVTARREEREQLLRLFAHSKAVNQLPPKKPVSGD
jgi:hypothetical protein